VVARASQHGPPPYALAHINHANTRKPEKRQDVGKRRPRNAFRARCTHFTWMWGQQKDRPYSSRSRCRMVSITCTGATARRYRSVVASEGMPERVSNHVHDHTFARQTRRVAVSHRVWVSMV
jgi:hypothetical protein